MRPAPRDTRLRAGALVHSLLVALCVCAAVRPTATHAQARGAVEPSALPEAQRLYRAGRTAYVEARYQDALYFFQQAHALSRRPRLLYNMCVVHEALKQEAEAVQACRRYLAQAKKVDKPASVRAKIRKLERTLTQKRRARARAAAAKRKRAARVARASKPAPLPSPKPDVPEEPISVHRLGFWLALGGAVGFGITGAVLWSKSEAKYQELDSCLQPCFIADDLASEGERMQLLTRLSFGLSLASTAGATVLLALATEDKPSSPEGQLALGVHPAGFVLRGRF